MEARNNGGTSPLAAASGFGHVDTARLLILDGNANVNATDTRQSTALIRAARYGRLQVVSMLLECGANPNMRDQEGNNALHYAR